MASNENGSLYGVTGPGSTPPDTEELSGPEGNPYSQGSPKIDLTNTTDAGFATPDRPLGYYSQPTESNPDNPYHDGAGTYTPGGQDAADYIAHGMNNLYAEQLSRQQPTTDEGDVSYQRYVSIDEGQNDQLIPPDKRR